MTSGDPKLPAEKRRGWSRTVANHCTARIRSFFKWCVAEGHVSATVHAALCTLAIGRPSNRASSDVDS